MDAQLRVAILRSSDDQLQELLRVIGNYIEHIVGGDRPARAKLLQLAFEVRAELEYRKSIDERPDRDQLS